MRQARGEPVGSESTEDQLAAWVGWYNKRRLHGACGGRPPTEYEGLYERGELPSLVLRPNQRALLRWGGRNSLPRWRRCSDGEGEFGEARFEPVAGLGIEAEFVVSAAQVLNERMSATDHLGAAEPLQTSHWTSPGLQPAMISFDRVVCVLLHDVARLGHERVEHPRVRRGRVGGHLGRPSRRVKGPGEEPSGCRKIPLRRGQDIVTCPYWSIARYRYTHCPATFR